MRNKNLFWGIFFIVAAGAIVVNQLGYFVGISLFNLVLTILLVPIVIESVVHLNFPGILFPLAILGILYAENLGIQNLVPWPILVTALLGSIGFSILFKSSWPHRHIDHFHHSSNEENFGEIINTEDESNVEYKVNFGSGIKYVNSENLKTANLSCSFGALKVYFDNSKPDVEGARINIEASFSGVELYIPKTWKIVNEVNVSLGGIEEKNNRYNTGEGSTVTLTGKISFSGVEIIYV